MFSTRPADSIVCSASSSADVARAVDHGLQHHRRRAAFLGQRSQVRERHQQLVDAAERFAAHAGAVGLLQRAMERQPVRGRVPVELADRRVADAALGHVEDALHRHFVFGVHDRPQVREQVLHFLRS